MILKIKSFVNRKAIIDQYNFCEAIGKSGKDNFSFERSISRTIPGGFEYSK